LSLANLGEPHRSNLQHARYEHSIVVASVYKRLTENGLAQSLICVQVWRGQKNASPMGHEFAGIEPGSQSGYIFETAVAADLVHHGPPMLSLRIPTST
jgi:hypothetical protein